MHWIGLIAQLLLFQPKKRQWCPWRWLEICSYVGEGRRGTAVWSMTSHQPRWHGNDGWSSDWLSCREHCKNTPFLENPWRFSFKITPFLLESMDHASNQKEPSFSMQMRTSVCSTFVLDCRGRGSSLALYREENLCVSKSHRADCSFLQPVLRGGR